MYVGSSQTSRRDIFRNGVSVASTASAKTGSTGTDQSSHYAIMAHGTASTFTAGGVEFYNGRIGCYSIGYQMTAVQALAYYNAMAALFTAFGRS
jgi:hypothetical protein